MEPLGAIRATAAYRIGLVVVGGVDGANVAAIRQACPYVVRTMAIDRDSAALHHCSADRTVLIGDGTVHPIKPRTLCHMARAQAKDIAAAMADLDLVLIVAGLYGAAGQGIAPVVADIARHMRIATLAMAVAPAEWQGPLANPGARYAMQQLQRAGATVFPVPSQRMAMAPGAATSDLGQSIQHLLFCVEHALNQGQIVGIDMADLPKALNPGGMAAMGFGSATGPDRVQSAIQRAITHPLLGTDNLCNANGVLLNISGADGLQFSEVLAVFRAIQSLLTQKPWFVFSGSIDTSVGDELIVSLLATVPEAAA